MYALDNCFSLFHASLDRITCLPSAIDSVSEIFWSSDGRKHSVFFFQCVERPEREETRYLKILLLQLETRRFESTALLFFSIIFLN